MFYVEKVIELSVVFKGNRSVDIDLAYVLFGKVTL